MFSREEPAFILLQNTPEITELTPGWSQLPETHQTTAQAQRRQTPLQGNSLSLVFIQLSPPVGFIGIILNVYDY